MSNMKSPWPVGRTIKLVRPMAPSEYRHLGWDDHHAAVVIELDDGSVLFASQDEEGNGAGSLFWQDAGQGQGILGVRHGVVWRG